MNDRAHGAQPAPVVRAGLLARLNARRAPGVTLISAPAGSGKTTLVRSWLDRSHRAERAAWVTVDPAEADEQHFWRAVIGALAEVLGTPGDACIVSVPSPTPAFDPAGTVDALLVELVDLAEPVTLVVDDLQELAVAGAFERIDVLLRHRPPALDVVLITRRDPKLAIHRLRLSGELVEIRNRDLRFSAAETGELLRSSGVALTPEGQQTLQAKTEGWAAGLRLAALSLAGHPDPQTFVREFSGTERTVSGYLVAEVLDRQPPAVRSLLLRTSVLPTVNGELADLLTGSTGSEAMLQDLERANAFVAQVDVGRTWFRYHQLFRDLLQLELRSALPDEVPRLHLAAAGWFEDHDMPLEAVAQAQAAGAWRRAASMLFDRAYSLILDGREAATQALLAAFPAEIVAGDPELQVLVAASALRRGLTAVAATTLDAAELRAAAVPEARREQVAAGVAILRLSIARALGDFESVVTEVAQLTPPQPAAGRPGRGPVDDVRSTALLDLGIVETWLHRVPEATAHLEAGLALARATGRSYLEVAYLGHLAMLANDRSFAGAAERSREAVRLAESHGWGADPVVALPLAVLGGSMLWTGRFADAATLLGRARDALGEHADPATALLVHLASGALHAAQGRLAEAFAAFDAADGMQGTMRSRHGFLGQLRSFRLQTELRLRAPAVPSASVRLLGEDDGGGEWATAAAALHLAEGAPQAALRVLAPVLDGSAAVLHPFTVVTGLLLAARAQHALGRTDDALDLLDAALERAAPEHLVLPFALASSADLLEPLLHRGTAHAALAKDVLAAVRSPTPADGATPPGGRLSESELRVLTYLPTNLPAGEIAAELYLSVHTVKTHLRHIYDKLGVHRRSEAVELARAQGLLRPLQVVDA